jgi:NADH:ubiquinone oxidoreductase subunit F (NADH-binding)
MTYPSPNGLLDRSQPAARRDPSALPRLTHTPAATSFASHERFWGPLPNGRALVEQTRRSGLRGRGGAGFPTALKLDAVLAAAAASGRRRRRPIVVANGTEGEPASAKDRTLLEQTPHLVLDGMVEAAFAVGAGRAIVCVKADGAAVIASLEQALAERRSRDEVSLELSIVPAGYVAGEESALVNWLSSGVPAPTITPPRPADRGVEGRPTLVDNVETMANLALIGRFGADWWRGVGSGADPGSILLTISGAVAAPGVYEVGNGSPLRDALTLAGAGRTAGVLVGGYFGTWLTAEQAGRAGLGRESLARFGGSVGCGVVIVLPEHSCPLEESARVARWLSRQSAGQCGPCVNGLPAIAGAMEDLARGRDVAQAERHAHRWADMADGRGACKLPDGTARFVRSALRTFAPHLERHRLLGGPCDGLGSESVLHLPGREVSLRWG